MELKEMELKEYKKLHSEWYDLASSQGDSRAEIEYLMRCIADAGQPVLELGCGTGRVLRPLLERGVDITGIDTSRDMLDRCRQRCAAMNLTPDLCEQDMRSFSLPRKFNLVIFASGGLSLFVDDRDIHATFQRVIAHLKPGGMFAFDFEHAPALTERGKPDPHWTGDWVTGPGDVVIAFRRKHRFDPATRTWKQLMIFEKFVAGRLQESEADERVGREFLVEEAIEFARAAGFVEIKATHWLTDDPPTKDSRVVSVRCRKQGDRS